MKTRKKSEQQNTIENLAEKLAQIFAMQIEFEKKQRSLKNNKNELKKD